MADDHIAGLMAQTQERRALLGLPYKGASRLRKELLRPTLNPEKGVGKRRQCQGVLSNGDYRYIVVPFGVRM